MKTLVATISMAVGVPVEIEGSRWLIMKPRKQTWRLDRNIRRWCLPSILGALCALLAFKPFATAGAEGVRHPGVAVTKADQTAPSPFSGQMIRVLTALSEQFLVTSNAVRKKPNLPLFQYLSRTPDAPERTLAITYTNMHGTFDRFQEIAKQIGFARLKTAQLAFIQGFITFAAGTSYDQQAQEAERRGFAPPEPPGKSTILQPAIDARKAQLAPFEAQRDQWLREAASLYDDLVNETRRLVVSATAALPRTPGSILAKPDPRPHGIPQRRYVKPAGWIEYVGIPGSTTA